MVGLCVAAQARETRLSGLDGGIPVDAPAAARAGRAADGGRVRGRYADAVQLGRDVGSDCRGMRALIGVDPCMIGKAVRGGA